MITRYASASRWLLLALTPLIAGVLLSESSSPLVQRAALLLLVYGVAIAFVWLGSIYRSRRASIVRQLLLMKKRVQR